jgi:hypothetical protein
VRDLEANRDAIREQRRKWRESNRDAIREQNRKYRESNRDAIRERSRKWQRSNRDAIREQRRKWRESNVDVSRERSRKWRESNRDAIRERERKYYNKTNRGRTRNLTKGTRMLNVALSHETVALVEQLVDAESGAHGYNLSRKEVRDSVLRKLILTGLDALGVKPKTEPKKPSKKAKKEAK